MAHPVAEVAPDLADDGRRGVGGEANSPAGVEPVDGVDQADHADLRQVFERLAAVGELAREVAHEIHVREDELLADLGCMAPLELGEELRGGRVAAAGLGGGQHLLGHLGDLFLSGLLRQPCIVGRGLVGRYISIIRSSFCLHFGFRYFTIRTRVPPASGSHLISSSSINDRMTSNPSPPIVSSSTFAGNT